MQMAQIGIALKNSSPFVCVCVCVCVCMRTCVLCVCVHACACMLVHGWGVWVWVWFVWCVCASVLVYGCAGGFHIFHLNHALDDSVILKKNQFL
jgi:hypothetical protein